MEFSRLNGMVPKEVWTVLYTLHKQGYEAFLVGGGVRDIILNRVPLDFDIATSALPQQVEMFFPQTRAVGIRYGTVTVIQGDYAIEVTTMRTESTYEDGRRPSQVDFSASIFEDVRRRDFTVNALAYDGSVLFDLAHGIVDIRSAVIRTVGCPEERFTEDGLRVLRAIRLGCKLSFSIDPRTIDGILRCKDMIHVVAPERVRLELEEIFLSDHPDLGCALMVQTELMDSLGFTMNPGQELHCSSYWSSLTRLPRDLSIRLAVFLLLVSRNHLLDTAGYDAAEAELLLGLLKKYTFPQKLIERARKLIMEIIYFPYLDDGAIRRVLHRLGKTNPDYLSGYLYEAAIILGHSEASANFWVEGIHSAIEQGVCTSISELQLNGEDLLQLGVPRGKQIGETLEFLLQKVLDNPAFNTRKVLIQLAMKRLHQ